MELFLSAVHACRLFRSVSAGRKGWWIERAALASSAVPWNAYLPGFRRLLFVEVFLKVAPAEV
jgi:hypothetical protein